MSTGSRLLKIFAVAVAAVILLTSFQKRAPRFEDLYECYIIIDAEVSNYEEDDFEQVDYEELMSIISRAKRSFGGFVPAKEVHLFDDEGIRYRMYVSSSFRFIRIDSNYFKLSKSRAKRLKKLIAV